MFRVRDLTYSYNSGTSEEIRALDSINLDIAKGEFVALIGHNGCGKSTLARHLKALLVPSSGEIWVDGLNTRDQKSIWEIRRKVGMVFQNPDNQLVATVVTEDVAFGPENLGLPSSVIKERVEHALHAVDLEEYRNHAPHLLSGGQKQRVAIAGIIAMEPDCIILDEATSMLDPLGRREVMDTVTRLNRERGITVICITHSMDEVIEAGRVIVMNRGTIAMDGAPAAIFSKVEKMRDLHLDVPCVTELARELSLSGFRIRDGILTETDLFEELKALL
jgi:energy-coupling factor transport system ATP-binding protein